MHGLLKGWKEGKTSLAWQILMIGEEFKMVGKCQITQECVGQVRSLYFIFSAMGKHWIFHVRVVTQPNLCLRQYLLQLCGV
jgi:hypothetical protein